MLDTDRAAEGFNAVGSKHRLSVLLELVKIGSKGLSIGEIQDLLNIPLSTLAHHLNYLKKANLNVDIFWVYTFCVLINCV